MRKRILSFILCLAMVLSILPAGTLPAFAAAAAAEGGGVTEAKLKNADGTGEEVDLDAGSPVTWNHTEIKTLTVKANVEGVTNAKIRITTAPGVNIVNNSWQVDDSTVNKGGIQFTKDTVPNVNTTYDLDLTGYDETYLQSGSVLFPIQSTANNVSLSLNLQIDYRLWPKQQNQAWTIGGEKFNNKNAITVELLDGDDVQQGKDAKGNVSVVAVTSKSNGYFTSENNKNSITAKANTNFTMQNGGIVIPDPNSLSGYQATYVKKVVLVQSYPKVGGTYATYVSATTSPAGAVVSHDDDQHTITYTWTNVTGQSFYANPTFKWPSAVEEDQPVDWEKMKKDNSNPTRASYVQFADGTIGNVDQTSSYYNGKLYTRGDLYLTKADATCTLYKYQSNTQQYMLGHFEFKNSGMAATGEVTLAFKYGEGIHVRAQKIPAQNANTKITEIKYKTNLKEEWQSYTGDATPTDDSSGYYAILLSAKDSSINLGDNEYFTEIQCKVDGYNSGYFSYRNQANSSPGGPSTYSGYLTDDLSGDKGKSTLTVTPTSNAEKAVTATTTTSVTTDKRMPALDVTGTGFKTTTVNADITAEREKGVEVGPINVGVNAFHYYNNIYVPYPAFFIYLPAGLTLDGDDVEIKNNHGYTLVKDTDYTLTMGTEGDFKDSNSQPTGGTLYKVQIIKSDTGGIGWGRTETTSSKVTDEQYLTEDSLTVSYKLKIAIDTPNTNLKIRNSFFVAGYLDSAGSDTNRLDVLTGYGNHVPYVISENDLAKDNVYLDIDGNRKANSFFAFPTSNANSLTINSARMGLVFRGEALVHDHTQTDHEGLEYTLLNKDTTAVIYLTQSGDRMHFRLSAENTSENEISITSADTTNSGDETYRYFIPVPKKGLLWESGNGHIQNGEFAVDLTLEKEVEVNVEGVSGSTDSIKNLFEVTYTTSAQPGVTWTPEFSSSVERKQYENPANYKTYNDLLEAYIKNHAADTGYDASQPDTLEKAKQDPEVIAAALGEVRMIRVALKEGAEGSIPSGAKLTFDALYNFTFSADEQVGASVEFGACGQTNTQSDGGQQQNQGHDPTGKVRIEVRTGRIAGIAFIDENWNGTYDEGSDTLISFEPLTKAPTEALPDVIEDVTSGFSTTLKEKINSAQSQLGVNLSGVTTTLDQNVNGWLNANNLTKDKVQQSFLYQRLTNKDPQAKPTNNSALTGLINTVATALNSKLNDEIGKLPGGTYTINGKDINPLASQYSITLNMNTLGLNVNQMVKNAIQSAKPGQLSTTIEQTIQTIESKIDALNAQDTTLRNEWNRAVSASTIPDSGGFVTKTTVKAALSTALGNIKTAAKKELDAIRNLNTQLKEYESSDNNALKAMVTHLEAEVLQTQGNTSVKTDETENALISAIAGYLYDLVADRVSKPGNNEEDLRAFLDKNRNGAFDAGEDEYLTTENEWSQNLTITAVDQDKETGTGTHNAQKPTLSELSVQNPFNNSYALSGLRGTSTEGSEKRPANYVVTIKNPGITTTPTDPIVTGKEASTPQEYKDYDNYLRFEPLEAAQRFKTVIEDDGNNRKVNSPENAWKKDFESHPEMTKATYNLEIQGDLDHIIENRMRDIAFQRPHKVTFAVRYAGDEDMLNEPVATYTYYVWHGDAIPTPDTLIELEEGYHWAGSTKTPTWTTAGGDTLQANAKMESTDAEVTYTAVIADTGYTLTYDANGGYFGDSKGTTTKEDDVSHYQRETVSLVAATDEDNDYIPKHDDKNDKKVVFIGWSAKKHTEPFGRIASAPTELINKVIFGAKDETVYAVWGYDENSNGQADIQEAKHKLTYDVNTGNESTKPKEELNKFTGEVLPLSETVPTHGDSDGKKVVFIGWILGDATGIGTEEFKLGTKPAAANKIYSRSDTAELAKLKYYKAEENFSMRAGDVTLFALWGYDTDKSGIADVLETGYTLTLEGNISGHVDGLSGYPRTDMFYKDTLRLPVPTTETKVDGKAVVFLGWSETESGVLDKNSTKPSFFAEKSEDGTIPDKEMPNKNLTLYAVWGKDTDGDGKADVDETKLTLTYDPNTGSGGPTDHAKYVTGETVELSTDPKPTHEKEGDKQILFVGWSAEKDTTIYTDKTNGGNGPDNLITQVEFKDDQDITVYAVWAYDENNNNVPDYQEGYSHVTYLNVPVSSEVQPNDTAAYLTGTTATLWQPTTTPWKAIIDGSGVVFLGWSKTVQNGAPDIVKTTEKAEKMQDPERGIVQTIVIASDKADASANNVYAVWAEDLNTNGKPDYTEQKITVQYNDNGGTWKAPDDEPQATNPTTVTQQILPGLTCELPDGLGLTKANGNGYPHVFAGWSENPTTDAIPAAMDKGVAEQLLASPYTVLQEKAKNNVITLYAVYAEDINGNEVADYLEFEYTLDYNAGEGGTTNAQAHTEVKVAEVVPLSEDIPTHTDIGDRKVVFIGWIVGDDEAEEGLQLTKQPAAAKEIYNRNANLGDLRLYQPGERYSMRAGNTTLYAVWGYDDNGNNKADATENKYTLALGSNISGAVNGMPANNPNPNMLENEALNLPQGTGTDIADIKKPALTIRDNGTVNGNDVVFVGWSETAYPVIPQNYEEDVTLYEGTRMPAAHLTLYAVWAVDNNGNGTPDYLEAKSEDSYTIVYDVNGGEYNPAHGLGAQAPDLSNVTGQIPGVLIRLADAQGYEKTMTKEEAGIELKNPAVFAGWSLTNQAGCIPFNVTDERLAAFGLVSDPFTITDEIVEQYAKNKVITLYAVYAEDQTGEGRPSFEVERRYMEYYANGGEARDGYQIAEDGFILNCGMGDWSHSHTVGKEVTLPEEHLQLKLFNRMIQRADATIIGWKEHQPYEKVVTSQEEADGQIDKKVTVSEDITKLYAVWAIDFNHNGKADYLEQQFEHKYYDNSNLYGTMTEGHTGVLTGTLPAAQNLLLGTAIDFDEGLGLKLTETDATGTVYHRYVQVGWSANPCRLAQSADDAAAWSIQLTDGKRFVSDVTELSAYAIWALDDNNDGIADYSQDNYTVSYDLNEGTAAEGESYEAEEVLPGNTVTVKQAPTRTGYTFTGWQANDEEKTVYQPGAELTVTRDLTLTAQWRANGGGGGGGGGGTVTDKYTVKYDLNGADTSKDKYPDESVSSGTEVTVKDAPSREDFKFAGWKGSDEKTYQAGDKLKVTSNVTLTAQWVSDPNSTGVSDLLNTKDHMDYLHGYGNGLFGPNNNMTRAEAAQMFYNLLKDKNVKITASFTDVTKDAWYAEAVNTLASLGILQGVGEDKFAPNQEITRAEFVTIIARFAKMESDSANVFSDVKESDWFYPYVLCSIKYGWINGYPDGGFHPYEKITRAETAAVMNRILGRKADTEYVDSHVSKLTAFSDVASSHWAYYDIREATNAHDYSTGGGAEKWTVLK